MSTAGQVGEYVLLSKDEFDKLSDGNSSEEKAEVKLDDTKEEQSGLGITPTTRAVISSQLFDHITKMRKEGVIDWNKSGQLPDAENKELGSLTKLLAAALRSRDSEISSLPGYDWFVEALREYKIPKSAVANKQLRGDLRRVHIK